MFTSSFTPKIWTNLWCLTGENDFGPKNLETLAPQSDHDQVHIMRLYPMKKGVAVRPRLSRVPTSCEGLPLVGGDHNSLLLGRVQNNDQSLQKQESSDKICLFTNYLGKFKKHVKRQLV